ncbi:uncharacterized protein PgNI_12146 [Pyricularia grisea]|uniref:Uncharacterized protein n=1 Tax=Pyricularia grisea TaxID=148305 RepID=A0A6P8AQ96_PYRGI|nr:uncharacterized protein PgNI_12146 [Pyricularia grisea]TLD04209.1 hypothetical protein PgNI_12146 [Pyricularia grisea]
MNFKSFITLFFIGATMGAAIPSTDGSAASHLERRDTTCHRNCINSFYRRYFFGNPLVNYCTRFCAAKGRPGSGR